MSQRLDQKEIIEVTGLKKPYYQELALRELGYIVLGRNRKNEVQALAAHPRDPALAQDAPERVTMEW